MAGNIRLGKERGRRTSHSEHKASQGAQPVESQARAVLQLAPLVKCCHSPFENEA